MHPVPLEYDSADTQRPNSYAWMVVGLLCVVALLNYLDRQMIASMRDPIRADFHVTDAQFGLFTSVFLWSYAACSPLGGFLADRFGKRGVILTSLFFWSAATVATAFAQTTNQMLAARVLMGVSEACYIPAGLALISDFHRGPTRSLATGIHMTGLYIGGALGGIGGFLAEHAGWRFGFKLFGFIGIGYAVALVFLLRNAPPAERPTAALVPQRPAFTSALASLLSRGGFWMLLVINILVGVVNWLVYTWLPTFLKDRFHLGLGEAGISATAYIQVASFIGVLAAGTIADGWSRTNPRARSLVAAIAYLCAAPCLFFSATTGWFPAAIAGLCVFGLGRGAYDANAMPILRDLVPEKYSATGYGLLNLIGTTAGGVMVYYGGMLKDANVSLSLIFQAAAGCAAGVAIILFLLPAARRKANPDVVLPVPSESLGLTTSDAALATGKR